ncbi:MAG: MBL fold metallo-hydrolase, partial [Marivivens sp.]|nr:MBL fold metallo-hydrolase [Marivivens sp.]
EARMAFAAGAIRNLQTIEDYLETFEDGDEVVSGISAFATNGHTPGHTSFEIRGGSDSLMIIGDAIGNHHVGFEVPSWASGSDQDQDMGIATRERLLDRLANEQMAMIGFHFPFPGVGRAEKSGDTYKFVAA